MSEKISLDSSVIAYNIVSEHRTNFITKATIDALCSVDMWIKESLFILLHDNSTPITSGGTGCTPATVVFGSKCYHVN